MQITIVTVSDRASRGEYEDLSGRAIEHWLKEVVISPYSVVKCVIPDGIASLRDTLIALCDEQQVDLILTTGGTGPAPRDETPEAMREVLSQELPGFGEQLRRASLDQTPTAILWRQTAGTRGKTLIINLPGKPSSIRFSLDTIFAAVPYCLDLIGAGRIEPIRTSSRLSGPCRKEPPGSRAPRASRAFGAGSAEHRRPQIPGTRRSRAILRQAEEPSCSPVG